MTSIDVHQWGGTETHGGVIKFAPVVTLKVLNGATKLS
jgi:hypothetical protein